MKTLLLFYFRRPTCHPDPDRPTARQCGYRRGNGARPVNATMLNAEVSVHNAASGYNQAVVSLADGSNFLRTTITFQVKAPGFGIFSRDVELRNSVPG